MNKKMILILGSVLMPLAVWVPRVAAHEGHNDSPSVSPAAAVAQQPAGKMFCPVSGDEAKTKFSYEHNGKTYYFCCPDCIKDFKKDPEKWIAAMKKGEMEKGSGPSATMKADSSRHRGGTPRLNGRATAGGAVTESDTV